MFKAWTLWDVANYTLILIWLDCAFFGLEDAVMPAFWIMVVWIVVSSIIRRACGQLKTPDELRQDLCDEMVSDAEAQAKMLRDEYQKRVRYDAETIRQSARESREAHQKEGRLREEAEETLARVRREENLE